MPVMQLKKVVLPAPLGPIRAVIWGVDQIAGLF